MYPAGAVMTDKPMLRVALIAVAGALLLAGCFPSIPTQAARPPVAVDASLSPDGSRILFTANHGGDMEIYVVGVDGAGLRALTDNDGEDYFPNWSPDGSAIVFSSDRGGSVEIYLMDADGANQRRIVDAESIRQLER